MRKEMAPILLKWQAITSRKVMGGGMGRQRGV
jgi:hypothetical protein